VISGGTVTGGVNKGAYMSSRALVLSAVAVMATAVGCAGSAAASSPAVTGTQLESALLPPTDFTQYYTLTIGKFSSGSHLRDEPAVDHVATMSCKNLLNLFPDDGFGATAYAGNSVAVTQPPAPVYGQSVFQFARASAVTALYTQAAAGYARCRSVTAPISSSPLVFETVHSVSKVLARGHQAFAVSMSETISKVPGRPDERITETVDLLVAAEGIDLFIVRRACLGSPPAAPALSDVIAKLIARVQALR
jgi:hypothetical protein